jgi:transposase
MLRLEEWMDIKGLHKEGHSIKQIARMSGHSRNTVRKVVRQDGPGKFHQPLRASCLDPFRAYLKERFQSCGLSAVRLLEEIRPMGYGGSIQTLRRFLRSLKPEQERLRRLTVRFETPPGKQAQADWAYGGRFPDAQGRLVPVYLFTMVLGFSRMLYIEFTPSMKLPWLLRCHLNAFAYFGGWPAEILYDNMKQVKLGPDELHPLFLDFVRHHGLVVKTHQIRRPRTKGKVERMIYYVKDNFLAGRSFTDLADLNAQGRHWLEHTANVRVHRTTGERPIDLLPKEKLTPLGVVAPYQLFEVVPRQAGFDGFVRFDRSRYSLPPEHAGQTVLVGRRDRQIVIRLGDMIVAEHEAAVKAGSTVADPKHVEALWKLSLRRATAPPPRWQLTFDQEVATASLETYEQGLP